MNKKTFVPVFVLTLSALYSIAPLLIRQEFISGGWDQSLHISFAHQANIALKEKIFYPRWLPFANGGYGSPTFIFYSPLFYVITGFIDLYVQSVPLSLKLSIFIGFFLSGLTMFLFMRNFCSSVGAVAAGIAYQLLPYHIFDFYIRETYAETFAFFWLPLMLHFAYRGFKEGEIRNWIGLAFSYAGLIMTHLVTAYIFSLVIAAFAIFNCLRGRSLNRFIKFLGAISLGLSISSVYFIPMFLERKYVHMDWLTSGGSPWRDYTYNFLFLQGNKSNDFYIHLYAILVLQVFLVMISSFLLIYNKISMHKDLLPEIVFFVCLLIFSIFMSSPPSAFLWRVIPGHPTILFPWRWLLISSLSASILIGISFDSFSFSDIKRYRKFTVLAAVFSGLVIGNIFLSSRYILSAAPMGKTDLENILKEGGGLIEYRPIWLKDKRKDFSNDRAIPVAFNEGIGTIEIFGWKSHSKSFKVDAQVPSVVRISTFYYPGWTALIDGREVPIDIEKDSGAMLINLPPGENTVLLEFRDTPLRRGAKWISIISLFAAILGLVMVRLKDRRKAIFTAHISVSNDLRLS